MSDECDLDELTAFLEASDSEDDIENTKEPVSVKTEQKNGEAVCLDEAGQQSSQQDATTSSIGKSTANSAKDVDADECGIDEIEAFLQASDDDDDDDDGGVEGKPSEDNITTPAGRSNDKADISEAKETTDDGGHLEMENMEFENFDECDFDELDDLESKSLGTSPDKIGKNGTQSSDVGQEAEPDKQGSESEGDNDAGDEDDTEQLPQNKIEAEMAAMAKRMEELKAMLIKSKSPSCTNKKKKSGSDSEDKSHDSSVRSNVNASTSRHCSLKDQSRSPANNLKSSSKLQNDKKWSVSTPKSTKKQKDSTCSEKDQRADRHHSDIINGKLKKSTEDRKLKDNGNNKHRTSKSSHIDEDEDSNPFFAKTEETKISSQSHSAVSFYKKEEPVDSKTLFGDSDSDWEDLCGEEKSKLSEEGQELKKLISSGQRKREAHTPSYDPTVLKKPNMARWTDTSSKPIKLHPIQGVSQAPVPVLNPETGTVSGKYRVKEEYMPRSNVVKEDERESVTDPFCGIRIINPRIPMDVFKKKMEGRNLVKISRLVCKTELQRENWVTIGVVVHKTEPRQSAAGKTYCIWKLSDLHNCDKTVTFFLFGNVYKDHWKNDLGIVIGLLNPTFMDKAEKNQAEVAVTINHPQQLLVMGISKDLGRCRGTTKAGSTCSSFINKMQGEFCTYHVQSAYRKSSSKRTELQASTGVTPKAFTQQKNKNLGSGCFFYGGNTYTTQKPQAKSSKDKITLNKLQSFDAKKAPGKITTMSLHELEPDDEKKINKLREKDKDLLQLLSVPSAGSMNFVKHLVKKDAKSSVHDGNEEVMSPSASAKDLLKEHAKNLQQRKQQRALLSSTPTLGKGLSLGGEVSLDVPLKKGKGCASAELAKQLAIAKVKAKGGLGKEDPNAVRKKLTSPEAKEKIKKRVAEDMDKSPSSENKCSTEPPAKKSKLLGDLDLNSPEVQKLLKKTSKHKGALAEAQAEQEDRYFSALEKKEQMEDKMGAIMEVPVKLFACLQCKYRYFSVHERCKKENHTIKSVKGVKRFFKCKQCKKRTVSIDRLPTKACKDCGESKWERVSMLKERNGPKLESEELCLRGNEQKYVGSLAGKPSLNV